MTAKTYRELALQLALKQLGVKEHPAGSNSGPKITTWLRRAGIRTPAPWCMAFVWCMFDDAGLKLEYPNLASVGFFQDWAAKHGYIVAKPARGDVVCYRFDADSWPDHVGIVKSVSGQEITAVEGNTAVGNDSNGGQVMLRNREISRCAFARIPGSVPSKPGPKKVRQVWDDLPGEKPKPPWFWEAVKELDRRRKAKAAS